MVNIYYFCGFEYWKWSLPMFLWDAFTSKILTQPSHSPFISHKAVVEARSVKSVTTFNWTLGTSPNGLAKMGSGTPSFLWKHGRTKNRGPLVPKSQWLWWKSLYFLSTNSRLVYSPCGLTEMPILTHPQWKGRRHFWGHADIRRVKRMKTTNGNYQLAIAPLSKWMWFFTVDVAESWGAPIDQ